MTHKQLTSDVVLTRPLRWHRHVGRNLIVRCLDEHRNSHRSRNSVMPFAMTCRTILKANEWSFSGHRLTFSSHYLPKDLQRTPPKSSIPMQRPPISRRKGKGIYVTIICLECHIEIKRTRGARSWYRFCFRSVLLVVHVECMAPRSRDFLIRR